MSARLLTTRQRSRYIDAATRLDFSGYDDIAEYRDKYREQFNSDHFLVAGWKDIRAFRRRLRSLSDEQLLRELLRLHGSRRALNEQMRQSEQQEVSDEQRRRASVSRESALVREISKILRDSPTLSEKAIVKTLTARAGRDYVVRSVSDEVVVWATPGGTIKRTTRSALRSLVSRARNKLIADSH